MTTCECGCGQLAPIAKESKRRLGHVKGQPVRFVSGHNARGKPKSEEHRRKIGAAMTGNRNPFGVHRAVTSTSPHRVHAWLNRWHPKAGRCEECGARGDTDYAFLHHPAPHTRNRSDYRELCRLCHTAYDVANGQRPDWKDSAANPRSA
jgi:hypothetical protein